MHAMIVYSPPSSLTHSEQVIFNHGTHKEKVSMLHDAMFRGMGIPPRLVARHESSYSSARMHSELYREAIT